MQQLFLDIPFTLSKEQMTKINKFLVLLEDSGVGAFGDIKQNNSYTRARRRGLESVTCELMLVYLGINIKKLFSFYDSNKTPSLWTAPKNTEPESFAKLSSKRLSKKGRRINDKIFNNKHT